MKKQLPDALRLKLSKAGKKGWRAKIKSLIGIKIGRNKEIKDYDTKKKKLK